MGRLEDLCVALCVAQGTLHPETRPRHHVVFCGDHGAAPRVSAWPQVVSSLVARTIGRGRGVSSAIARTFDADTSVVDVALCHPFACEDAGPGVSLRAARVRSGTGDMTETDALPEAACAAAWRVGAAEAERAAERGVRVLVPGETGIGNTASAAAIVALILDVDSDPLVGRGAGADDAQLERKRAAVRAAVGRARAAHDTRRGRLRAVAGAELVAMAGCMARGAELGMVVILDGALAAAAALLALELGEGSAPRRTGGSRRTSAPSRARRWRFVDSAWSRGSSGASASGKAVARSCSSPCSTPPRRS
jgi:nicotinate-nucleotide--dimethylbenzimidazole phosphoribosyltransferase